MRLIREEWEAIDVNLCINLARAFRNGSRKPKSHDKFLGFLYFHYVYLGGLILKYWIFLIKAGRDICQFIIVIFFR